jgi:hypothetical protein
MTEYLDMNLGQAPERLAHVARGKYDRDALDREPASREPERLGRRAIQPLGVVDQAEESALPGGLRQKSEDRERHEKRVGRRPRTQSEGDIERVALRTCEALTESKDRRAQLLHSSEWELHLTLDPGCAKDLQHRGLLGRVIEQGGLADAGLAMNDKRAPESVAGRLHQPVKVGSLAFPTQQLHPFVTSLHVDVLFVALSMTLGVRTMDFRDASCDDARSRSAATSAFASKETT